MNPQQQAEKMSQIYAKSFSDEGFRRSLLADPAAALRAEGISLPAGVEVVAVENDDKVFNLVIPALQTEGDLSDAELTEVTGGFIGMAMMVSFLGILGLARVWLAPAAWVRAWASPSCTPGASNGASPSFSDKDNNMTNEQQFDKFGDIIARSWTDATFKNRLLAEPGAVLRAEGLDLPEGVEIIALENTDKVFNLVIPVSSAEGELSDTQLEEVAGGFGLVMAMGILAAAFLTGGAAAGAAGIGAGFGIGKGLLRSKK